MADEVVGRRQDVLTLSLQVEQLLKRSSSELSSAQTDGLKSLRDDVCHRLNTVSVNCFLRSFCLLSSSVLRIYTISNFT